MIQDVQERDTDGLLQFLRKQLVRSDKMQERLCRISCFGWTTLQLAKHMADPGIGHTWVQPCPCHPDTHTMSFSERWTVRRKWTLSLYLLTRGVMRCCYKWLYNTRSRTDPWLWIGKRGQANKSYKPILAHCFTVVAVSTSGSSKSTKRCGTALTVEQTILGETERSNSKDI